MANIAYFPQEFLDLQEELVYHDELREKLALLSTSEFELRLSCIATHCNLVLDGYYTAEDQKKIAAKLCNQLRDSRSAIILLS